MSKNKKAASIVRHREYGRSDRPTIYYLTGYGGKVEKFAPHIHVLTRAGFRIVAFEYDKTILNGGNPQALVGVIKDLATIITQDKSTHKLAGVYGVSLGSWLGANMLVECGIRAGMFNTGAANLARAVWENPYFLPEKTAFQTAGYTRKSLDDVWGRYEFTPDGRRWKGKYALVMSSNGDEIIDIKEVQHNIQSWQNSGDEVHLLVSRRLKHGQVILRHMLRVHRTIKFFKAAVAKNQN